jgi:hypothetical protein
VIVAQESQVSLAFGLTDGSVRTYNKVESAKVESFFTGQGVRKKSQGGKKLRLYIYFVRHHALKFFKHRQSKAPNEFPR